MVVESIEVKPGESKTINGNTYLRLESGDVLEKSTNNVIIKATTQACIELVSCQKDEIKAYFWIIDGTELNAIGSKSKVEFAPNGKVIDIYKANSEEWYIKYTADDLFFIVFIGQTKVYDVWASEYDITSDGNYFYTWEKKSGEDDKNFCVISLTGMLIDKFPFEVRRVKDYKLYYSNNNFFTSATSKETSVDGRIKDIQVITNKIFKTLDIFKIETDMGIYFFSERAEFLAGPVIDGTIEYVDNSSYYIFEKDSEKIVGVFYIQEKNGRASCISNIKGTKGIEVSSFSAETWRNIYWFEVHKDNGLSDLYSYNLECVMTDVAKVQCHYVEQYKQTTDRHLYIIGYNKRDIPVMMYTQRYLTSVHTEKSTELTSFDFVCKGIQKNSVVCKDTKHDDLYFFETSRNGRISSEQGGFLIINGTSCSVETIVNSNDIGTLNALVKMYLVRDSKGRITIYNSYGEKMTLIGS